MHIYTYVCVLICLLMGIKYTDAQADMIVEAYTAISSSQVAIVVEVASVCIGCTNVEDWQSNRHSYACESSLSSLSYMRTTNTTSINKEDRLVFIDSPALHIAGNTAKTKASGTMDFNIPLAGTSCPHYIYICIARMIALCIMIV